MKKFITSVFYFFLFSIILYPILILLMGLFAPKILRPNLSLIKSEMQTRLCEAHSFKNIDVLILGSSHAYRGFDPRIFNLYNTKIFNLGSSSQTPIQTKYLLEKYLLPLNPKLIIYEVFPECFSMDGIESTLDILSNEKNDFLFLKMALEINNIKAYNTLLFSKTIELLKINEKNLEHFKSNEDKYITGGYVEKKMKNFKHIKMKNEKIELLDNQLLSFKKNINLFKGKEIPFVLVYAPVTKTLYKSYTNKETFDSIMKSIGPYMNFNEPSFLDDSLHFYDSNHLNQNGVAVFNKRLIREMKNNDIYSFF